MKPGEMWIKEGSELHKGILEHKHNLELIKDMKRINYLILCYHLITTGIALAGIWYVDVHCWESPYYWALWSIMIVGWGIHQLFRIVMYEIIKSF